MELDSKLMLSVDVHSEPFIEHLEVAPSVPKFYKTDGNFPLKFFGERRHRPISHSKFCPETRAEQERRKIFPVEVLEWRKFKPQFWKWIALPSQTSTLDFEGCAGEN